MAALEALRMFSAAASLHSSLISSWANSFMMVQTIKSSDNIEKDSLAVHVEMCAHRHAVLETKITALEKKVEDIEARANESRKAIFETVAKAAAIISIVVSVTLVVLDKLH